MYNKEIVLREGLNEGYRYFCDKEHPLAKGNSGMVLYHRHVASIHLGKWIGPDEVVHHIDHNKLNNLPSNLKVLSRSDHAKLHCTITLDDVTCPICRKIFHPSSYTTKYCCLKCKGLATVKNTNITLEELQYDIWRFPYTKLTTKYNLSDVGLKKRAKALGCRVPPPYFHNKTEGYKESIRIKERV